jgi:RimJ/RimL family protein N-acetyltransferase
LDTPPSPAALRTERLLLRPWRDADLAPFAALNADPRVMEHLPAPLDRAGSDALADRIRGRLDERGWGLWAAEIPGVAEFAGFVGLATPAFEAAFTPCVEVGWRLAHAFWGRGYAPEAARACLAFGFERLGLDEIVSFTTRNNRRSRRVMRKLGMTHDPAEDFDHPNLPAHSLHRRHVLYRLSRRRWEE